MAGVTLGFLKYVLGFDSLQFKKGMTDAERDLAVFGKRMQRTAASMAKIGAGLTIAVTAPLIAFSKGAFTAASDAAELQSSFDTTFGAMAGQMTRWAVATGDAMGRSTQEIQKAANTFGIFFNTAVPPGKAAAMSQTFAKLAEDLGSFFNVDTDIAIEKLRSGLAGEAEPLRAFGVFLSEAAVKAKAAELGIKGVGGALTEQQKIQVRAALILEQTTKAQGDVARTSAGTANQVRAAKAAFEELQVTVGTKLLPVITPLITKIGEAVKWFTSLPQPVQNTALAALAISATFGPLLVVAGGLLNVVTKIGPALKLLQAGFVLARVAALATLPALVPILVPLGLIAAAVGVAYLAWKNWDKIKAIVASVYGAVKTYLVDKFNAVVASIKQKVDAVIGFFRNLWDKVVGHSYVPELVDSVATHFARLASVMVEPARQATALTAAAFKKLKDEVGGLLDELFPEEAEFAAQAAKFKLLDDALNSNIINFNRWVDARNRVSPGDAAFQVNLPSAEPAVGQLPGGLDDNELATTVPTLEAVKTSTEAWGAALAEVGRSGLSAIGNFNDGLAEILVNSDSIGEAWHNLGALVHDVAQQWLSDLIKLVLKQAELAALKLIFGSAAGGGGFGGGLAAGGPVSAGTAYIVGEQGPEIFLPGRSGQIVPNHSIARGVGGNDMPNITLTNYNDFRGADAASVGAINSRLDQMEAALPGRVVEAYHDARQRFVIR